MLVFGWRTAVLALVSAQVLILAAALWEAPQNRAANRRLAALLVVLVGLVTPYTLGFAGFYDAYPWLTFAPFAVPLAVGPLALGYVRAWTGEPLRPPLWAHLIPAAAQFVYGAVCFALPMPAKTAWADGGHEAIEPVLALAAPLSLAAYAGAALASLRHYRRRLGEVVSDEARFALGWLGRALIALTLTLAVWAAMQTWEVAAAGLTYFQRLGLYLAIAALALYLGIEGWRHAGLRRPALDGPAPAQEALGEAGEAGETGDPARRDWRATGAAWAAQVDAAGWWREPDLTLAELAARLGTNTHYLSRALNEGLGQNFASFVNGRRAAAVRARLEAGDGRGLLELAFEAGFNSKASFNRAYAAAFGESPSAARRRGSEAKLRAGFPETGRAPS